MDVARADVDKLDTEFQLEYRHTYGTHTEAIASLCAFSFFLLKMGNQTLAGMSEIPCLGRVGNCTEGRLNRSA